MTQQGPSKTGLRAWQHGVVFVLACAVIISRRPDAVFHAQFWGEDGAVWYADAYNCGWWATLFREFYGYLEIFPRIGAFLALLVPLSFAPFVLNLIAIGVQAFPVNVLLSSRSSPWGGLRHRVLLAGVYLALPNSWEISATITNSQWLLALIAVLLLVATKPDSTGERLLDLCVLSLCGLDGPFCFFMLPIVIYLAWKPRDHWRWLEVIVLAMWGCVQAWTLLNGGFSSRPHYHLGASPVMLARILAGQVYLGALFGGVGQRPQIGFWFLVMFIAIAAGGTILVAVCFLRTPLPMKLFLLFSALVFASSLAAPGLGRRPLNGTTAWEVLVAGAGNRYWFFPTLAFAWTILWCYQSRAPALKVISAFLLCVMCFSIVLRWQHRALPDMLFAEEARRFESAPVGTSVTIPENPEGWSLSLVKLPPR
ncbi:MAG TPA: hypothetical protein VMW15_01090 [Terracidiphilus sp.]|nr:hypothetical protein [Terracidiphilus sp.]